MSKENVKQLSVFDSIVIRDNYRKGDCSHIY